MLSLAGISFPLENSWSSCIPSQFSLHKSLKHSWFPLEDAALGWIVPSVQYNLK